LSFEFWNSSGLKRFEIEIFQSLEFFRDKEFLAWNSSGVKGFEIGIL
jgi:hypothetical protein